MAELRLQLADRDKRLAELTEQSLQILDRLAEAREVPSERAALCARIAELQELLADTRQRIRLGTRAVLGADLERKSEFEVAIWGFADDAGKHLRAAAANIEAPVTALLSLGHDTGALTADDLQATTRAQPLSVQETECRTSAHFWNEVMAMTHAPVVVVLAAGVSMTPESLARLAAVAAADGIAIASPALLHPDGRSLGRSERSLLDLVVQPNGLTKGVVAVPFASPEAFAISRRSFQQLGPFDQDLVGDLALAEWVLRGIGHSLRCVGVADAEATATRWRDAGSETAIGESDRLIVLARHRPQQLAAAALAANSLWEQEPMALASVLRAVFRRLPNAAQLGPAVDLLVVQAQTISGWKRLAPALRDRLVGIAAEMRVPVGDSVSDPGLVTLAERLQATASVLRERSAELEVRSQEAHDLRHRAEQSAQLEQALRQDIIARSNTIDALRHELLERERAIASLREELGHRQGERDRLIDHLGHVQQDLDRLHDEVGKLTVANSELDAERTRLQRELGGECDRLRSELDRERSRLLAELARSQEQVARLQGEELARSQQDAARLQAEAAQANDTGARIADLEQRLAAEIDRSRGLEGQLGKAIGRTQELDPQLSEARTRMQQLEQMLADESSRVQRVLAEVDDLRGGNETLRREHGSLQEQRVEIEARAHELVLALRDRERWIGSLLREVRQRRLVRRELTAQEAEFLARHGGDSKP